MFRNLEGKVDLVFVPSKSERRLEDMPSPEINERYAITPMVSPTPDSPNRHVSMNVLHLVSQISSSWTSQSLLAYVMSGTDRRNA